jgi:hypothetical protein
MPKLKMKSKVKKFKYNKKGMDKYKKALAKNKKSKSY